MTARTAPRLIAITDLKAYPDCVEQARNLCAETRAGTVAAVVRDRHLSTRARLELARRLREITSEYGQFLYVADRVDLARAVEADGVHLSSRALAPGECRMLWGGGISRSGHGLASLSATDWRALGAVFVSPVCAARKGNPSLGMPGLSRRAEEIRSLAPGVAVYALGGVTSHEAQVCLRSGADGVAAIAAVWDPTARAAMIEAMGLSR